MSDEREDVRVALDALGPRWCEDQLVMEGSPERPQQEDETTRQVPLLAPFLWDD